MSTSVNLCEITAIFLVFSITDHYYNWGQGKFMNDKFYDLNSAKQDKMINAALHLFAINGYRHASTDDIIKEAGISKGLLFHYFESKAGLYSFLIQYSVRFLLFEYDRCIGEERQYFEFYEKLENAKLNVIRNYPYMYSFMEKCITETIELDEAGLTALNKYKDDMAAYGHGIVYPKLKDGITMYQVDVMLNYTIEGITASHMRESSPDIDALSKQVAEYIALIKKMTIK